MSQELLKQALKGNRGLLCLDCGKCTANCPVSRHKEGFSPRAILKQAIGGANGFLANGNLWACLTCGLCNARCPSDITFSTFMKDARRAAVTEGYQGKCTHGGILHHMMRLMAADDITLDRLGWLTEDLKTSPESNVLYFVGCIPFYDVIFSDIKVQAAPIARGTVKLLNAMGITPNVLADERCCGHDLYWMGDRENFRRLARKNLEIIKAAKPEIIVTSCAECYRTLKLDYPKEAGPLGAEVYHISEFIASKLDALRLKDRQTTVTFQDPCRLGRHAGVYDAPRKALGAVPGLTLKEMELSRAGAMCCGTSAWTACDAHSKAIQIERLKMAARTEAEALVTACPKCYIHFRCAQAGAAIPDEARIQVKDLTVMLAEAL